MLVLTIHDQEFVGLMKMELSSHTGFSMPEKFLQVHRETGPDGKDYSKINAVDWYEPDQSLCNKPELWGSPMATANECAE